MPPTITDWIQAISAAAIVILTVMIWWITRRTATANERMAAALDQEHRERYAPYLDVDATVVHRDSWVYSVEVSLANKGLSPLRIARVAVACGTRVFHEERDLILAVGETKGHSVRFNLHDLAYQTITEGAKVELELTVEYSDPVAGAKKVTRKPWLEYRERPRGR
jgi:hypothetical protein